MTKKPTRKKKLPAYKERLILFIDFLGFSEIVEKTTTDAKALNKLIQAMSLLSNIGDSTNLKSQKVTQFSDSVVASYEVTEPSAVFHLLNAIAFCVIDLAHLGYLVRGGVTAGKLLHTSKRLVGPAMLEAYRLETKAALVPRVVIDRKLLEIARTYRDDFHSEDDEEEYASHFMTIDKDGQYFFDYVSHRSVVEITGSDQDLYPDYLDRLREHLVSGLGHSELSVRAKYVWLHRQYLAAIELVEALPSDHPFRVNEPDTSDAILSLPKLTAEASQVRTEAEAAGLAVAILY